MPKKLENLLSAPHLKHVHHVALGFEDCFLLTWRDQKNQDHIDSAGLPSELVEFLYKRNTDGVLVRDIPQIRCFLGAYNSSFIAHDGAAYLWMDIPHGLLSALQSRIKDGQWTDKPRVIALGADNNFLLLTEKHDAVWELSRYTAISRFLDNAKKRLYGISEIRNAVLHLYRFQCSITQSKTGTVIHHNIPPHSLPGLQKLITPIGDSSRGFKLEMRPMTRRPTETKEKESTTRKPSALQERAKLKREWSEHSQEFKAQSRGLKLSLSLSVSVPGLRNILG